MSAALSAAERIRSTLLRPGSPTLTLDTAATVRPVLQHLLPDGSIALLVTDWSADPQPAMLELPDQLNLPQRQPIRSLTWITGLLETLCDAEQAAIALDIAEDRPHPELLEVGHSASLVLLRPLTAVVVDAEAATSVSIEELIAARPDPFCMLEDVWLAHLEDAHDEILQILCRRLPPALRGHRAHPLAIDRHGLSLRVQTTEDATTDVRLPFATPAQSPLELGRAVRALASCVFHRGLHARHDAP
ncbi:DUF2470 domain-containing protein [Tomitella biformata]|uniref:DUF2470 domain-containing protein n=1 Tax=Tomitella biformata TaxID=630403 RepID=UPI000466BA78|nr:DUF2470 domain-containing protein [Tomitella biformata]